MSIPLAIIMLIISSFIELILVMFMFFYGFRNAGLPVFILSLWNLSAIIALTVYILSKGRTQQSGYMEVSNYLNLNKIANKDDKI
jgi:hypothetical protein